MQKFILISFLDSEPHEGVELRASLMTTIDKDIADFSGFARKICPNRSAVESLMQLYVQKRWFAYSLGYQSHADEMIHMLYEKLAHKFSTFEQCDVPVKYCQMFTSRHVSRSV